MKRAKIFVILPTYISSYTTFIREIKVYIFREEGKEGEPLSVEAETHEIIARFTNKDQNK